MRHCKTQLAAAVGAALLAFGTAVQAQDAPTVRAYGQVSRTLMHVDDGTASRWFHVDNEVSGTRFGLTGTAPAMPGLRAGFRIEYDAQSNDSSRITFANFDRSGSESDAGFSERHMDAWLEGAWGRVSIGQGDGAANGASETDLSGTAMANSAGVAFLGGAFAYRSAGALSPVTINGSINQQDFESRYDRLMYTTPGFGGFRAQASHGQKESTNVREIAALYGAKIGALGELAAALGWSEQGATPASPGGSNDEVIGGSISWLHGSGINLTYAYTNRDNPVAAGAAGRDSTFNYFKVGWKRGAHAIAADYAIGDDFAAAGDEATMWGIGYVWNPIRWLELYAAYKIHELDRPGTSLDEIKIGHAGTRIRF
jgi:predicted porin